MKVHRVVTCTHGVTLSTCTMGELEVIKAARAVPTAKLEYFVDQATDPVARDVWRAELARRKAENDL